MEERLRREPCGCRCDMPTGIRIHLCAGHQREETRAALRRARELERRECAALRRWLRARGEDAPRENTVGALAAMYRRVAQLGGDPVVLVTADGRERRERREIGPECAERQP